MASRQEYQLVVTGEKALEDSMQVFLSGEGIPCNAAAVSHCMAKHAGSNPFAGCSTLPQFRELAKRDMRCCIARLLEENGVEDYLVY